MKKILLVICLLIGGIFAHLWQPPVFMVSQARASVITDENFPGKVEFDCNESQRHAFSKAAESEKAKIVSTQQLIVYGYPTHNKEIYETVIVPYIKKNENRLRNLPYSAIINECTLLSFSVYRSLIGKSFYRWGGDIADLDDPQPEGVRYTKRYGLDCSGFATSGYEIATRTGLIPDTVHTVLFCSAGLKQYTKGHPFRLRGAVLGGNNNYRLDTSELAELGNVVFHLNKGEAPTEAQVQLLQPGDIVGLDGHVGVIAFIADKPYYLESGGYVLPEHGFAPVPAAIALKEFASFCAISVRRAN